MYILIIFSFVLIIISYSKLDVIFPVAETEKAKHLKIGLGTGYVLFFFSFLYLYYALV